MPLCFNIRRKKKKIKKKIENKKLEIEKEKERKEIKKEKKKTYTEEEVKKILEEKEKERIELEKEKEKTKKYKICIPVSELNPQDKFVTVGVNEKYATIERGVETEVELAVYEQLKNAGLV